MIEEVEDLPPDCKKLPHTTLAHGEVTGHSHRLAAGANAILFATAQSLFLRVMSEAASVVHEEHDTISLPPGDYRVWRQREYSPQEIRIIRD